MEAIKRKIHSNLDKKENTMKQYIECSIEIDEIRETINKVNQYGYKPTEDEILLLKHVLIEWAKWWVSECGVYPKKSDLNISRNSAPYSLVFYETVWGTKNWNKFTDVLMDLDIRALRGWDDRTWVLGVLQDYVSRDVLFKMSSNGYHPKWKDIRKILTDLDFTFEQSV